MINFRNETEERIYQSDLKRFELMSRFISPADKILKFGAGLGFQAQILEDHFPGNVTVLEIKNGMHPELTVPVTLYGGKVIPFDDNSFNVSIASHVLHHTPDPTKMLHEISRVTNGKIILIEEVWTNWLQKLSLVFNCWFKGYKVGEKQKIYFTSYQSEKKWIQTFKECGLEIEYRSDKWTKKTVPFRISLFVLKKSRV